jgi:pentatricopeptide repeat protein
MTFESLLQGADSGEKINFSPEVQRACTAVPHVLEVMRRHGRRPNMRDYAAALSVLARLGQVQQVEHIWQQMLPNIMGSHQTKGSGLMDRPSLHAWNARLEAHVNARNVGESHKIVYDMHRAGPNPDSMTYDLLAKLHGNMGCPEEAERLLVQRLERHGYSGYDALLRDGYQERSDQSESSIPNQERHRKKQMQTVLSTHNLPEPTIHSFNIVLRAYRQAEDVESVMRVYRVLDETLRAPESRLTPLFRPNVATYHELMSAHHRSGLEVNLKFFEQMRQRNIMPTAYTYHLLIKYACWQRPYWDHAERLWREMRDAGIQPRIRTCKVILAKLKRPRFEAFRQEVFEYSKLQGTGHGSQRVVF